jgi:hypothetical protein
MPEQRDGGVVRRGHRRAFAQHEAALLDAGHVVHGEHGVAGKALEQAVFHHAQRAAAAFFGRLEDQVQRAVERTLFGQVARRGQQHGRVAVVAAGVHHAGALALDHSAPLASVIGRASMSARRPRRRVPFRAPAWPTTPVPPMPRSTA